MNTDRRQIQRRALGTCLVLAAVVAALLAALAVPASGREPIPGLSVTETGSNTIGGVKVLWTNGTLLIYYAISDPNQAVHKAYVDAAVAGLTSVTWSNNSYAIFYQVTTGVWAVSNLYANSAGVAGTATNWVGSNGLWTAVVTLETGKLDRAGTLAMTGNLNMGGNELTNTTAITLGGERKTQWWDTATNDWALCLKEPGLASFTWTGSYQAITNTTAVRSSGTGLVPTMFNVVTSMVAQSVSVYGMVVLDADSTLAITWNFRITTNGVNTDLAGQWSGVGADRAPAIMFGPLNVAAGTAIGIAGEQVAYTPADRPIDIVQLYVQSLASGAVGPTGPTGSTGPAGADGANQLVLRTNGVVVGTGSATNINLVGGFTVTDDGSGSRTVSNTTSGGGSATSLIVTNFVAAGTQNTVAVTIPGGYSALRGTIYCPTTTNKAVIVWGVQLNGDTADANYDGVFTTFVGPNTATTATNLSGYYGFLSVARTNDIVECSFSVNGYTNTIGKKSVDFSSSEYTTATISRRGRTTWKSTASVTGMVFSIAGAVNPLIEIIAE